MRKADEQRFEAFLRDTHERHLRLATWICGDRHRADDVVQTVEIRLYGSWLRILRGGEDPAGYAYVAVRRESIAAITRGVARYEVPSERLPARTEQELLEDWVVDRHQLSELLAALTPFERSAIILRYAESLPLVEVATELHYSTKQTRRIIRRALQKMRAAASEQRGPE